MNTLLKAILEAWNRFLSLLAGALVSIKQGRSNDAIRSEQDKDARNEAALQKLRDTDSQPPAA